MKMKMSLRILLDDYGDDLLIDFNSDWDDDYYEDEEIYPRYRTE